MSDMTAMPQTPRRADGAESPLWITLLLGGAALLIVLGIVMNRDQDAGKFEQWKIILGVIATLGIFSILYKENPVFRFIEHIYIGVATGVGIVIYFWQVIYPSWWVRMVPSTVTEGGKGEWWHIFALLIGLLLFSVYFPKLAWMNRFVFGVLMGWAAGYIWRDFLGLLAPQLHKSFAKTPVTTYAMDGVGKVGDLNNIHLWGNVYFHLWHVVFIIVLVCVMAYFFFSVEHRAGWIRKPANAGRYFLMITLGAIFGTTVMGRFSLVIERFDFLRNAFTTLIK